MSFTAYLVGHVLTDPSGRMRPQVESVRIYSGGGDQPVMVPQE